jgi:hypothetical protein
MDLTEGFIDASFTAAKRKRIYSLPDLFDLPVIVIVLIFPIFP